MLKKLFYLCITTLSLGQLVSLSKEFGLNIYLFDFVIGTFAIIGTIYFLRDRTLVIPKNLTWLYLFCLASVISLIKPFLSLPTDEFLVSAFYLVRLFIYITSGMVVTNMIKNNLITQREVIQAFIYSGVFIAVAGFVQLILLPDFEQLDPSLGWDPHKNRLASTFFDPNFVGGYLVLCITLLIYKIDKKSFGKVDFALLVILAIALLLTFSRSSWGMLAAVILFYGLFKYRLLLLGAVVVAFLAYFAIPRVQTRITGTTDPADSAAFRFVSWNNAWAIAKDNLLIGVGFNTYRYAQKDYGYFAVDSLGGNSGAGTDSSLLLILATTGVVGLSLYLCFLAQTLNIFLPRKLLLFRISIVVALLFQSQFINTLFYPQIMFLLVSLGVLYF